MSILDHRVDLLALCDRQIQCHMFSVIDCVSGDMMEVAEGKSQKRVSMAHDLSSFAGTGRTASAHAVATMVYGRM